MEHKSVVYATNAVSKTQMIVAIDDKQIEIEASDLNQPIIGEIRKKEDYLNALSDPKEMKKLCYVEGVQVIYNNYHTNTHTHTH